LAEWLAESLQKGLALSQPR